MKFEPCQRGKCIDVEIINNCELEDTEEFIVTLLSDGVDQDIDISHSLTTTSIEINDGDGNYTTDE